LDERPFQKIWHIVKYVVTRNSSTLPNSRDTAKLSIRSQMAAASSMKALSRDPILFLQIQNSKILNNL